MTLALAALVLQEPLRYTYGEGHVVTYAVEQSFRTVEDEEETVYYEDWKLSFASPLAGGAAKLKVEKTQTGMLVDGVRIQTSSLHVSTEDRSPRGDVRNRAPSNQIDPVLELRLLRIADIEYPAAAVVLGTAWVRESKPADDGLHGARWTWTPEVVKDGRLSGTLQFIELTGQAPIRAEGKFTVSTADGWPIELSFKAINTYQLGDEEKLPTVFSFSMKRRV